MSVLEKSKRIDMATSKLGDLLTESSLTQRFKELYDSTILDYGLKMDAIHKKVEEDRKAFARDYTLMTADYNTMQHKLKTLTDQLLLLQKDVQSFQLQIHQMNNELLSVKQR